MCSMLISAYLPHKSEIFTFIVPYHCTFLPADKIKDRRKQIKIPWDSADLCIFAIEYKHGLW